MMKILIIGLGSIAKKHINSLKKLEVKCDIYAFRSSPSSQKHKDVIDIYSFDVIKDYNFDFFLISNPTSEHINTITKLIKYNKPLFIEKPIFASTGDREKELVDEIKKRSISTYVACNLRFLDCLRYIKQKINNLRINEVNIYAGSYLPDWRPNVDYRKSYSANKKMGGGVHIDLIHEIDYAYWLFGNPNNKRTSFRSTSSLNIDSFDYANYLFDYSDFSVNIILNYYRRDSKRILELVFDQGTYIVNLIENTVKLNDEIVFKSEQKILDTYDSQMDFFLKNIVEKDDDFNTIEKGYKVLELCF